MAKKITAQQLQELKHRAAPINYNSLSVNQMGELQERSALLDQRIVEGYGVIWGNCNDYDEMFVRGAFAKSIKDNGPGSNANYQLKLRDEHGRACALFDVLIEDEIGLYFRTKPLDEVEWCDDLLVQLRSGTINNFSIGFKYIWDKIQFDDANDCMIILEARLFEVSAVAIPADMETFAIRSLETDEKLIDETETFINSLPNEKQLQARKIFALYKSLNNVEPGNPLEKEVKPEVRGIDYGALTKAINNLQLS